MTERLRELVESLSRHPLRTLVTMGSVAWGTFVLIVLLGFGQGLQNTVRWQFRDDATNSVWVYRGKTSRPWAGNPVGRFIKFTDQEYDLVGSRIEGLERQSGRFYPPTRDAIVAYGDRTSSYGIRAVHPDHQWLEGSIIVSGRFLNDLDVEQKRKVIVIGKKVSEFLFRGIDPVGSYVSVVGLPFRVIGVFDDVGGESELEQVYIPITTGQVTFGGPGQVHQIMLGLADGTAERAEATTLEVRQLLADRLQFDPKDTQAIRVRNNVEEFARIQGLFQLLDMFVWLVGVGTVMAGVVGVSNITLVSVRERSSEIALRKALGATPAQIVRSVVEEAVLLTAVSGYLGVVGGVVVLTALRAWLPENDYVRDPQIQLAPALVATVLLAVAGAVAGFFPAWLAARVPPVEGLRGG